MQWRCAPAALHPSAQAPQCACAPVRPLRGAAAPRAPLCPGRRCAPGAAAPERRCAPAPLHCSCASVTGLYVKDVETIETRALHPSAAALQRRCARKFRELSRSASLGARYRPLPSPTAISRLLGFLKFWSLKTRFFLRAVRTLCIWFVFFSYCSILATALIYTHYPQNAKAT